VLKHSAIPFIFGRQKVESWKNTVFSHLGATIESFFDFSVLTGWEQCANTSGLHIAMKSFSFKYFILISIVS
jgi:hypothetical protein